VRDFTRERLRKEGEHWDADRELVRDLEAMEGLRDWEHALVERCAERVNRYKRALLLGQRADLMDIQARRGVGELEA